VAVEKAVDQMQIARPAASGTDRQFADQMRFGAGGDLLVTDVQPFDLALPANRIGQAVEAVTDNAVDPFDAGDSESFGKLVRSSSHGFSTRY
jgi:hypothetical protein